MKTAKEFNEKWADKIEPKFRGLEINNEKVVEYLDKEFEEEVKTNSHFKFAQVKSKWGSTRIYAESDNTYKWEEAIDKILKEEE